MRWQKVIAHSSKEKGARNKSWEEFTFKIWADEEKLPQEVFKKISEDYRVCGPRDSKKGNSFQKVGDNIGQRKWLIEIKLGAEKRPFGFFDCVY